MPKRECRRRMRTTLKELSPGQRNDWDAAIVKNCLAELRQMPGIETICLYASRADEIDITPLATTLLQEGISLIYPKVEGDARLSLYYVADMEKDLIPGAFELMEPDPTRCESALPYEIDVCLVPGLAFDRSLHRLGRGKGYYDRMLSECIGTIFLAACYDMQILETIPHDSHDILMDMLITETGLLKQILL